MRDSKQNFTAKSAFEAAAPQRSSSLARQFVESLGQNKKWWLLPILIAFGLFAALLSLGTTAVAPFIYTLF
jgi:hypothetical protein